jgi:hypothetical protein
MYECQGMACTNRVEMWTNGNSLRTFCSVGKNPCWQPAERKTPRAGAGWTYSPLKEKRRAMVKPPMARRFLSL